MLKNCLRLYIYMVVESYGEVQVKYNPGDEGYEGEKVYLCPVYLNNLNHVHCIVNHVV